MIEFHCNICHQKISVPNHFLGKTVKCLSCGNILKAVPEVKVEQAEETADVPATGMEPGQVESAGPEQSEAAEKNTSLLQTQEEGSPRSSPAGNKKVILVAALVLILGLTAYVFTKTETQPPAGGLGKPVTVSGKKPIKRKPVLPASTLAEKENLAPPARSANVASSNSPKQVNSGTNIQPPSTQPSHTVVSAPPPTPTAVPTATEIETEKIIASEEPAPGNTVSAPPTEKQAAASREIPDKAAQAEALKEIRTIYKEEYRKSTLADREVFAKELLQRGRETHDNPVTGYVLIHEAMELAGYAGNKEIALAAAEELSTRFNVNTFDVKVDALTMAGEANRDADSAKDTAEAFLRLTDDAVTGDNYKIAYKCATAACKYAALSQNESLITQTRAKPIEVKKLGMEFEATKVARKTLETNMDDPRANLAVGKFLCLAKGTWEDGLPLLVKGSDEELKALAEKELTQPIDSQAQVDLGDMWWEQSDKVKDKVQQVRYKKRAVYWYRQGSEDLSGIVKAKVEKRIQEIDKAGSFASRERISKRRPLNLLKLTDPQKDPVAGFWRKNKSGELISDNRVARIEMPYQPPEEYDFRVSFTRMERNDAVLLILSNPSAQSHFCWVIGGWGNTVAGFTHVGDKQADNNPTTVRKPIWLLNRNKYLAVVQVRKDRIRAFLNNELITDLKTDYSDLTPERHHDLRNKTYLGVGSWFSPTVFHKIEVLEITGTGTIDEQTVGIKAPRNRRSEKTQREGR